MSKLKIKDIFESYIHAKEKLQEICDQIEKHKLTAPEINEEKDVLDLDQAQEKVDYETTLTELKESKNNLAKKKQKYIEQLTEILKSIIGKWVNIEVDGIKYNIGVFSSSGDMKSPYKNISQKISNLNLKIKKLG